MFRAGQAARQAFAARSSSGSRVYRCVRFSGTDSGNDYPQSWYSRAQKELKGKDPHETLSWNHSVGVLVCFHFFI